ncbi:DnaD domain protein [Paenibacillus sp. FJAT-26967]|uniref:DnaD domain protein n=1 Tax=Paenibacillus sp. FJAT-26967 TaxID=1729690 RepID=UPI00083907A6|nr:DnaD domain protein [Paenibacillus sp. FJAT-26967]
MRLTNLLHFTENHRFCVYRDFALSSLDYKMLSSIYQPMIGGCAISLYHTLFQQLSADKAGYAGLEQQRKLFLSMELDPGERSRKLFIEQTSRLEAVGLLQTSRIYVPEEEDYIYEYTLFCPLSPNEFFRNQHLTLLLRDKIGKFMLLSLRDDLTTPEPEELTGADSENLSVPFYELFSLNTHVIDYELEQALYEASAGKQTGQPMDVTTKGYEYADLITRFPRGSYNRIHVENLKYKPEIMISINMVARKYSLTLQETCRLLDEDGMFDEDGELQIDSLQYKANLYFRQGKKREEERERFLQRAEANSADSSPEAAEAASREVEMQYYLEVPAFLQASNNEHQYNTLLKNEPYTRVLQSFFTQGPVPNGVLDIFEKIDLNYKLKEEVINVLIHYIHIDKRSWAKSSIEAVASDMLGKHIATFEEAVDYVRQRIKFREQAAAKAAAAKASGAGTYSGRSRTRTPASKTQKPQIPIVQNSGQTTRVTDEELEEMLSKAKRLDEMFNS